jgi:hypothetical protein
MPFTTIVAPEQVRQQFTALRDKLKATDKLLMQACWDTVQELLFTAMSEEDLAHRIDKLRADQKVVKAALKPAAKKAPKKEAKKEAPKAKKEKAPKAKKEKEVPSKPVAKKSKKKLLKEAPLVLTEGERIIAEDDDVPCFVSVG